MSRPDPATDVFEAHRPRLARLAYRMLGSLAEAEDVVQEAWLRWSRIDPAEIREPAAWLTRTTTRLALDQLKSARARRETYVGSWLPEPLVTDPEAQAEAFADDLTLSLMTAMERLSPLERAAFLLHDVFEVGFDEVAATLERDPASVRQLASRARRHVQEARPRYAVEPEEGERIARAFFDASRSGDVAALGALLVEGATLRADGGGKVIAFHNPIRGAQKLLRLFAGLNRKYGAEAYEMIRPMWIDGLPGYVSLERGRVLQTTALAIEDGRIVDIFITRNPDKLARVAALLDLPGRETAN
ncbi:sigma-70 family RNA polymerase sigma factor [uncultured Brevundimonas sp.]|uniref:sigma-70 family RNA polymerase sigma factor n=1 Tax=uncultured Brevundimonas sp. TaxID=213418 RepID=UPI002600634F|nr:sigma-70 family RNA polymerase sigma factor [uncultured Brevundimonas sp.]